MDSLEDEECDVCGSSQHITANCPEIQVTEKGPSVHQSLARQTLPSMFDILDSTSSSDVVCMETIPSRTRFGPLVAKASSQPLHQPQNFELQILDKDGSRRYLDTSNENECNWLCLIQVATEPEQQNCIAFQLDKQIYYTTTKEVYCGQALKVWYARGYAKKLRKPEVPPDKRSEEDNRVIEMMGEDIEVTVDLSAQAANHELDICREVDHVEGLEMLACQFLYTCPICGDVTCNNQQELQLHMIGQHGRNQGGNTAVLLENTAATSAQLHKEGEVVSQPEPNIRHLENKSHTCKQCSYQAKSSSGLALHITAIHLNDEITSAPAATGLKKRVWTCTACGVVFSNPRSLGGHKKRHHPTTTKADVDHRLRDGETGSTLTVHSLDCGELVATDVDLVQTDGMDLVAAEEEGISVINVVIERQDESPEQTPGNKYGRGMRKKKKPKHLEISVVEVDHTHECKQCDDVFLSELALKEHVVQLHSFPCTKCNTNFTLAEEGLHRHLCREDILIINISPYRSVDANNENSEYTCPCCQQNYTEDKGFHDHLIWHGNNLQCDVCKGYCTTSEELEEHAVTCTGSVSVGEGDAPTPPPTHNCHLCSLVCVDSEALQAHLSMHTDFKCFSCDAQYNSRFGLQKHLLLCDQTQLERVSPVFACLECNSIFSTQHGLEYHNKEHMELTISCRDCQQAFETVPEFESHNCRAKAGRFVCEICDDKFKTSKSLANHYLKHSLKFDCVICSKSFEKKEELIKHSLECSAKDMLTKTGRIDCAHCQKSFTDSVEYRTHLSVHTHSQECKHCNRRFKGRHQLAQHLTKCKLRAHQISERKANKSNSTAQSRLMPVSEIHHTCPICGKSFVRKDYYLNHECRDNSGNVIKRPDDVQLIIEPEKASPQVVCYQCGKVFTSQSNLTKHLKLHGEKENSCEVCGKSFYHVHALRLHYDSVHTDKLKVPCDQCKRVFRNKYSLNQHVKQFHSSHKSVYACEICGKIFRQKGNMTKHMLAHDAARHYQCQYCTKTFKYPELLKRHSLLHTHGKAFQCDLCERRFVVQYELNKHLKEMHSNKVFVCGVCNETCRWRHTMRRHIKRKHPQYSEMADNSQYLTSLQRDLSELDQTSLTKLHTDRQTELHQQVTADPLVISMDSLTPEQIVELAGEQIVGHVADEGGTIHLYSQHGEPTTVEDLQKLSSSSIQPNLQQQLLINSQHFTINLSNGQAILTQVNMDDGRDPHSIGTSLLRPHPGGDVEVSDTSQQATTQVVIDESDHQAIAHVPENTVLLSVDGSIAYSNAEHTQHDSNGVNFTDITHLTDNSQDDGSKMMFFNILTNNHETTVP